LLEFAINVPNPLHQRTLFTSHRPLQPPQPIRVAIIDDDAGYRQAVHGVLHGASDMRLVASAGSQLEGWALLRDAAVDVLLVDPALPDGSGVAMIRAAALQWPGCSIMVSTDSADALLAMDSIEAGAVGYLLKAGSRATVVDDIRSVAGGGSPISPLIARQMLARLRPAAVPAPDPVPVPDQASAASPTPLSAREQQVLAYISKGFTAQEIAQLMVLSHFTVRSFVRRLYGKLKVTSKAEAIYEARTLGWLPD
jgi:DNA-binding NarL/FixJ family response regulator